MANRFTIVGLGEALFDMIDHQAILGGAPVNVAVHAHQLAAPLGGQGVVLSRVGQDDLGRRIVSDIESRGMTARYIQTDPDKITGKVYVNLNAQGQPEYDIVKDVAWDWIQFDPDSDELARSCDAVVFGTLAQRNGQSRNMIYRFLTSAKRAIRLFDVNLRQDYFDRQILLRSIELSDVLKLNNDELPVVARLIGIPHDQANVDQTIQTLIKRCNLKLVALTRGAKGTLLYAPGARYEGTPISYPMAASADAVGAGDACSAGILLGMTLRWPLERTLNLANHAGAFVASQAGGTPVLPSAILDLVRY